MKFKYHMTQNDFNITLQVLWPLSHISNLLKVWLPDENVSGISCQLSGKHHLTKNEKAVKIVAWQCVD